MKERIHAVITAAAVTISLISAVPVSALDVTMIADVGNMVNISVKDKNGNYLSAGITLSDTEGNKIAEFYSDSSYFRAVGDSEIYYDPIPDEESALSVTWDSIESQLPSGSVMVHCDGTDDKDHLFTAADGSTREFYVRYASSDEETALTLPAGTLGFYADEAVLSMQYQACYELSGVKYYALDAAQEAGNIAYYPMPDEITGLTLHSLSDDEGFCSYGVTTALPAMYESESEYVLYRMHLSDVNVNFNEDAVYVYQNEYGEKVIDLRKETLYQCATMLIVSGDMVNAVVPDEDGYITFYAEKNTRRFEGKVVYTQYLPTGEDKTELKSGFLMIGNYAAKRVSAVLTAPDLPETGINLINVPADTYKLTLTDIPEGYKDPDVYTIGTANRDMVQYINIVLQSEFIKGDVNEDGAVNIADATLVLTHYAQTAAGMASGLSEAQLSAGDTDGDSSITIADATAILRYYAEQAAGLNPAW